MVDELKPYPTYKDSGVPWLGEVPAHWELPRLGALLRERGETNSDGSVEEVLSVLRDRGVIPYSEKGNIGNKKSEDITRYKIVRRDDIVVNCMNVIIGSVGLSRYTGCLSPVYYVLTRRSDNDDPRYLNAYFQTKPFQESLVRIGNGILAHRMRIPMELLKCEPFPRPPADEQLAIVRYLDYVDRRIRRYIRAKQKLIALLNEQKQAIIHQAVTRGLDPQVRLKPSGVEWLGAVPEHWEVVRSKRVFSPRTELAQPGDIQLSATQAYGVISQEEYERRVGRKIVKIFRHLEKRRHVEVDDFVISMRSFQGGLERAWERGCIRSSYVVLRPSRSLCVSYFAQLFKSYGYIGALQATANFIRDGQDLNYDNFCAVDLPWPPLEEQERIAAAIDSALAGLVKTAQRAEREIALLREYRTRLIADVVTGKLDVRAAAAVLPEEGEEAEASEDGASEEVEESDEDNPEGEEDEA